MRLGPLAGARLRVVKRGLRQLGDIRRDPPRLLTTLQRRLIHHSRHFFRLFFGVITAVEAFGAVLIEPRHNPMKFNHRTPSVSRLAVVFVFGFAFDYDAQPPRSRPGSLAMFAAIASHPNRR